MYDWMPCLRRAGYKANLAAAGESDARLEARLAQSQQSFTALSLDHAVAAMPRLQVMRDAVYVLPRGQHGAAARATVAPMNRTQLPCLTTLHA